LDDLPAWVVDAPEIAGPIRLLRRVPEMLVHSGRIEKSVFDERAPGCGLSVTIWESPRDLDDILRGHENFGVVSVPASAFREHNVIIARAPLDGNPNHCEIFPRLTGGQQKKLRAVTKWVKYGDWVLPEHREDVEDF
jgi:hypothetical protein